MYSFSVFFRYFTKILNISIPVTQYRLGALLTGLYDCSGLPGPPRASADLLGRSPRPVELPATLSIQFSDQKHLRTGSIASWGAEPGNLQDFHPPIPPGRDRLEGSARGQRRSPGGRRAVREAAESGPGRRRRPPGPR